MQLDLASTLAAQRVLTEGEAAAICSLSRSHMRRLRGLGTGPGFVRLGVRRVGYRLRDLEAWLDARASAPALDASKPSGRPRSVKPSGCPASPLTR